MTGWLVSWKSCEGIVNEMFRRCLPWAQEQMINLWGRSGFWRRFDLCPFKDQRPRGLAGAFILVKW